MKSKRLLSLFLAILMALGTVLSTAAIFIVALSAAEVSHGYVSDGLVSLYSGSQNGRGGHDLDASVWEDLVGQNDLTINKNDKNYFTATGLAAEGTKHNFPQGIVDVVNGQAFTVELTFSEFESLGTEFNTFLNSSNDNFALFRRNGTNQIEFKFAANPGDQRHKIDDGLNLLQNAHISVTYQVGGNCYIYINGQLMAEKASPSAMGANDLFIGHDSSQKSFNTTYRSIRFYNRVLTAAEIKQNYMSEIDVKDLYIQNGLVSLYSGFDIGSAEGVWEDLVGENDVPVLIDDKNYFTDGGYHHTAAQNHFPQGIVDVVNGSAFTVELQISDLTPVADAYCTMLNSTNDNFALFRRNSSDVLEFKFAANAAGSRNTISDCEKLLQDALITVTYKVGGESRIYINGVLMSNMSAPSAMGADDFFFGHAQKNRHFEALYRSMRFYNRELSAAEVKANARADGYTVAETDQPVVENPGYVTVAQPVTNIVGDISMIRRVDSADELNAVAAAKQKPAIALYNVNANLDVLSDKGTAFSTVADVLKKTEFKILSAFYVKDKATADTLAAYLKDIRFYDCLVVSDDPAVIKSFRTTLPTVSGVIDYTTAYRAETALTEKQCLDIRRSMKENNGTLAMLPVALCSNETVQYLYTRQVNVWAVASDAPSVTMQYNALLSGAVGVVSDATDALLDIATSKLPASTMTRVTTNTGHRGIPAKAPENTLEGSILAFELGANVIELDVYLSKDGEVVVMHDGDTSRTCNKGISVEGSTLAQLKELYVNKGYENNATYKNCRIPTLREYLEYFKGKDCNLFIEIKSGNTAIVKACKKLVDEYDMYGQSTVITFNEPIMKAMRTDWPEMHVGALCGDVMTGTTPEAGLRGGMNFVGKYNATINPSMGGFEAEDIRIALKRGISIYPWTFRGNLSTYANHLLWGYSGLTGDNADVLGSLAKDVAYTGKNAVAVGESIDLTLSVTNYLRKTSDKAFNIMVLEGEKYAKIDGSKITGVSDGEVTLLLAYTQRVSQSQNYILFTQPITIKVGTGLPTGTPGTDATPGSETTVAGEEITNPDGTPVEPVVTDENGKPVETGASGSDTTAEDDGCASAMALSALLLVAGGAAILARKKERD